LEDWTCLKRQSTQEEEEGEEEEEERMKTARKRCDNRIIHTYDDRST